ncbi:MAG: homoserine dehydrogenase [Candidatus Competibacterales bacterium]
MTPVNIGLLGLGTVGSATARVLTRNASDINRRAGRRIAIQRAVVRRLERPNPDAIPLSTDPSAVVDAEDVDIVVELLGGLEPARSLVLRAIANGKHVVTANKALIAHHGNEIFAVARERGVVVAFEAAVAGGIPIIKAVREALAGNRITGVAGIINGTSNYILSAMALDGQDFHTALAAAQAKGFAEADPTFDIEGIDAAHKLTILASIAFGIPLQYDRVAVEGIAAVRGEDVRYASELGYCIKHLGLARQGETGVELRVHPTLIPKSNPLASVNGAMNAVLVDGDAVGQTLYYGPGAGGEPTASAVVADIVDVVRVLTADPDHRVPHLAFQPDHLVDAPIVPLAAVETAYYLRMRALDRPGVMAEVTRILADAHISIEALLQKEPLPGADDVPVVMVTHRVREGQMNQALAHIEGLASIRGSVVRLRLENLGAT